MIAQRFKDSMLQSMDYINRYRDTIIKFLGASNLIQCEGTDDEIARHLDISCGIDYILVSRDGSLSRGVGCRLQPDRGTSKYRTFTIRKERDTGSKTEFEKRKNAIAKGGLYPYLTMHGYIDTDKDRIDRMAIAKTQEIIEYCEKGLARIQHTGKQQFGQASFYVIDWDTYKYSGRSIYIYDANKSK